MYYTIIDARYIRDFTIWARFADGTEGEIDLAGELSFTGLGMGHTFDRRRIATREGHTLRSFVEEARSEGLPPIGPIAKRGMKHYAKHLGACELSVPG